VVQPESDPREVAPSLLHLRGPEEPPPLGKSWGPWYAAVLALLVLWMSLFYWLTQRFAE
jgi:hypothetical protein